MQPAGTLSPSNSTGAHEPGGCRSFSKQRARDSCTSQTSWQTDRRRCAGAWENQPDAAEAAARCVLVDEQPARRVCAQCGAIRWRRRQRPRCRNEFYLIRIVPAGKIHYIYLYTLHIHIQLRGRAKVFANLPARHARIIASQPAVSSAAKVERARACQPVPACAPCANFVFAHASARIIFALLAYNFERHKVRRPCGDVGNNHVGLLAVQKINISSQCACAGTHARLRRDDEVLRPHRYDRKDGVAWAKSRLDSIHAIYIYIYMMCVGAPAHEWAE